MVSLKVLNGIKILTKNVIVIDAAEEEAVRYYNDIKVINVRIEPDLTMNILQ